MVGKKKTVNASLQSKGIGWLAGMCHLRPAAAAAARDRSGRRNSLSHHSLRLPTQNVQRSSAERSTSTAERNNQLPQQSPSMPRRVHGISGAKMKRKQRF